MSRQTIFDEQSLYNRIIKLEDECRILQRTMRRLGYNFEKGTIYYKLLTDIETLTSTYATILSEDHPEMYKTYMDEEQVSFMSGKVFTRRSGNVDITGREEEYF